MTSNVKTILYWASDNDLSTRGAIISDVANAARYVWRMPLRDYNIEITDIDVEGVSGWPLVTVTGPETNIRILWHCFQKGCTMQQALKQGCYEADQAAEDGLFEPVR